MYLKVPQIVYYSCESMYILNTLMYVCTHVYIKYTYDSLLCPKKIFIKDHSLNISIIYYFTFPHVA